MRKLIFTILTLLLLTVSSCRSQKGAITTTTNDATANELFDQLIDGYKPYSDVYVPVTVAITSPTEMSISGRATIIRDKEIHISLRFLGMEVAVLYINNDCIYVVDKFHKIYFTEKLDRLLGDTPLNIDNVQDLMLGRIFIPGKTAASQDDKTSFTLSIDKNRLSITPLSGIKGVTWKYTATATTPPLLNSLAVTLPSMTQLTCQYSQQQETSAGITPAEIDITAPIKDKKASLTLQWKLNDAKWDTNRTVSFTPPGKGYKQMTLQALLESVKGM